MKVEYAPPNIYIYIYIYIYLCEADHPLVSDIPLLYLEVHFNKKKSLLSSLVKF